MHTLTHHLTLQAANNAWANLRLLRACGRLSQDELAAPRSGFFPSILATLNHILTVDWYYVDAMERSLHGQPPNPRALDFFEPERPFAAHAPLMAAQLDVDQRLLRLCRALKPADLDWPVQVPRRSGVMREPLPRLLSHLFQHQVHHRGQVHAMLSSTPVKPPQLDEFFCVNEAHLRAEELAALGLSEMELDP